jgi:YesN/AraC family two-component response regulator
VVTNEEPTIIPEEKSQENTQGQEEAQGQEPSEGGADCAELMNRICQLIEQQQLYLNPNLKVTDVADALQTSRVAVSNCIKSQRNCTFPQFVNTYRVALAQQLLSSQPDTKLAEVWTAAGFSSESSFYRIFKSITGSTPNDWKNNVTP